MNNVKNQASGFISNIDNNLAGIGTEDSMSLLQKHYKHAPAGMSSIG